MSRSIITISGKMKRCANGPRAWVEIQHCAGADRIEIDIKNAMSGSHAPALAAEFLKKKIGITTESAYQIYLTIESKANHK